MNSDSKGQGAATLSGNTDTQEINKFDSLAADWWNPDGEFRPLHDLNPIRLAYVQERVNLSGARVIDVGCGAGLLSEAMAACGASVTGIDQAPAVLDVAREHAALAGLQIDYQQSTAEQMAEQHEAAFDAVTCLEMLEHVPDPASVVSACAQLVKPGGRVFFSTLNRTLKAFALGIVAAEYVLGLLARGTHEYRKLIRPSELGAWARSSGLELIDLSGIQYQPLDRSARIGGSLAINYIACFERPAQLHSDA